MSFHYDSFKGEINLKDLHQYNKYKRAFSREHPDFFKPDGLILFCGGQGAGKTLSAVRYLYRLCVSYPRAVVVSNINLNLPIPRDIIPYESISAVSDMDNGYNGIILLLDEIQVEFNSLESQKIHPSVIQTISQQRKRRLHVIGTTQLFKRLAKPWREQCNAVVDCFPLLGGVIQRNSLIDFGSIAEDSNGNLTEYQYKEHAYYFRSPRYFNMYDTFQRVNRIGGGK